MPNKGDFKDAWPVAIGLVGGMIALTVLQQFGVINAVTGLAARGRQAIGG